MVAYETLNKFISNKFFHAHRGQVAPLVLGFCFVFGGHLFFSQDLATLLGSPKEAGWLVRRSDKRSVWFNMFCWTGAAAPPDPIAKEN